jgi:hypothetical protein
MITFACKQCGSRQAKPESQAGSLVFCDCGQSNRVPWATSPEAEALPARAPRPILDAVPAPETPAPPELPLPSRRTGRLLGKVNPDFCYQHDDDKSEATCAACKLPFCQRCVLTLQEQTLCGPCKNFRLASLGRPQRPLPLAVIALVAAVSSAPVALILSLGAAGLYQSEGVAGAAVALCLVAMALPVTGLALSAVALRRLDGRPQAGGRGLAASGVCVALAGAVWCAAVAAVLVGRHALG